MYELILSFVSKSEWVIENGLGVASIILTVSAFLMRNWVKFNAIYKSAEAAYHAVEEVAIKEGLTTEAKTDLFEEKFRKFMSWTIWAINPETLKTAHDLAEAFCDKYRSNEQKLEKKIEAESKKI